MSETCHGAYIARLAEFEEALVELRAALIAHSAEESKNQGDRRFQHRLCRVVARIEDAVDILSPDAEEEDQGEEP